MKEKEWKKEQKIPLLPVEFPEDSVMQRECRAIVEKSNTKAAEFVGKNQRIYWGPAFVPYFIRAEVSGLLLPVCIWESDGSDSHMQSSPKRR